MFPAATLQGTPTGTLVERQLRDRFVAGVTA
jgi:hypothetical protein